MNPAAKERAAGNGTALEARLARLGPNQRELLERQLQNVPVTGHHLVARSLKGVGVTHVYGVPGQPVYETFAACVETGLRTIGTHHQHPAAMMAAAHNYFAGRQVAVTIVSAGAPAAIALGAIVAARDNCWPLVVLAGTAPQEAADLGYFMALDAAEIYRPVTAWLTRVSRTDDIPDSIAQAFAEAMNGRPGPVLVQLPENVLTGFAVASGRHHSPSGAPCIPPPNPATIQQVMALLTEARRPLLIIGKGVRWSSPFAELSQLVDVLALPFLTSPIGRGAIPDDHPLCMNAIPWVTQSEADLVLVVGARLDWTFRYGQLIARDTPVVQVDMHAPEFARNRKVTLGVHADVGHFLRSLLEQVVMIQPDSALARRDHAWLTKLKETRQQTEARRNARACGDTSPMSPWRLARELRDALPRDAISIFDSNLVLAACQRMIPAYLPASRLTPGTSGCLGGGIPFAIAAKLVNPERPVVAVCGDFAFGVSAMELETAVRHHVPIIVVVANNDGNGGSRRHRMHFGDDDSEPIMMFQRGLRYDRIMDVFGGYAEHVDQPEDVGPALRRAIASQRPACINVAVDPDAPFPDD